MNIVAAALAVALSVLPGTTSRTDFTAAGGTDFAFTWKYGDAAQIQVYKSNVLQGAGYTLTPAGAKGADGLYTGGTVAFAVAPTVGTAIRIQRTLPLTQTSVWTPYAAFKAKTIEGQLDTLAMKDQQIQRGLDDLTVEAGTPDVPCNDAGLCSVGLTAATFTGALVGNASTATSATSATTAAALAANPADCGAGAFATAISAAGDLTCSPATNTLGGSTTYDFPQINAATCARTTLAVQDIPTTGAVCALGLPPEVGATDILGECYVSAVDTVTIKLCNWTANPVDPASLTYRVRVIPNP